jgi:hypothetical protein
MSIEKNTQAELETLRLPELQVRFREVVGEITRSPNRTFLIRRITEALAAKVQPAVTAEPQEEEAPPETQVETVMPAVEETATTATPESPEYAHADECEGYPVCEEPVEDETPSPAPSSEATATEKKTRGRFSAMTIEELQAKYLEVVERATGSSDRGYLIWKIREAEKGRITVGPRQARATEGNTDEAKTLPLRLEAPAITAMDAAWRQQGIPSRTEFLRRAIGHYLGHLGASDAAALFATK